MTDKSELASYVPDRYYVIAGSRSQWKKWAEAMVMALGLEHRLRKILRGPNGIEGFCAHADAFDKDMWYMYLPSGGPNLDKVVGISRWAVIPIGTWPNVWSKEEAKWLEQASLASMRQG